MSNNPKAKIINSLFTNKIVNEDLEIIHKSLVIAHQHYASKEKYVDALKITKVIYENLDKDGCFVLTAKNKILNNYNTQWNLPLRIDSLLRMLWGFLSAPGKYNLEKSISACVVAQKRTSENFDLEKAKKYCEEEVTKQKENY